MVHCFWCYTLFDVPECVCVCVNQLRYLVRTISAQWFGCFILTIVVAYTIAVDTSGSCFKCKKMEFFFTTNWINTNWFQLRVIITVGTLNVVASVFFVLLNVKLGERNRRGKWMKYMNLCEHENHSLTTAAIPSDRNVFLQTARIDSQLADIHICYALLNKIVLSQMFGMRTRMSLMLPLSPQTGWFKLWF